MVHEGESSYKCGAKFYAIGGEKLDLQNSFERGERGEFVSKIRVLQSLRYGDASLSFSVIRTPSGSSN